MQLLIHLDHLVHFYLATLQPIQQPQQLLLILLNLGQLRLSLFQLIHLLLALLILPRLHFLNRSLKYLSLGNQVLNLLRDTLALLLLGFRGFL